MLDQSRTPMASDDPDVSLPANPIDPVATVTHQTLCRWRETGDTMTRRTDLDRFYRLLDDLARRVGGPRKLKNCTGYMDWPDRGVYVFLEPGETRDGSDQRRVTRIGTHAVSAGSGTTLWDRLKQHYGTGSGSSDHPHGGNHRASQSG